MKRSWHAISEQIKEDFEQRIGTPAWLQTATPFDHNITLSAEKRAIAIGLLDKLMQGRVYKKRTQKETDFVVLCTNLLENKRTHPVEVAKIRNYWTKTKWRRASVWTIEAVNMLKSAGYIEQELGYGHVKRELACLTKIWPTEKFLDAFKPIRMEDCVYDPVDLVNLREADTDRPLDYRDTVETRRVREILRRVNMVTDRAVVQYVDPKSKSAYRLETRLSAVYTGDFEHGGRLYTRDIDGYQLLRNKDKERTHIHIDGRPTVELDYSGMLPRQLYSWEGLQYPANSDPYVIDGDVGLREVFKTVLLSVVNAVTKRSKTGRLLTAEQRAVAAVNRFLFDERKYYLRVHKRGLNAKNDLIPAFKAAHPAISRYFYSGVGLKAQNPDLLT